MTNKFDPQNVFGVAFSYIAGRLSFLGDQVTFVRGPVGIWEKCASKLHVGFYKLTASRLNADLLVFALYAVALILCYKLAARWYAKTFIAPRKIKKLMQEMSLQHDLANRYNRDKRGDCII